MHNVKFKKKASKIVRCLKLAKRAQIGAFFGKDWQWTLNGDSKDLKQNVHSNWSGLICKLKNQGGGFKIKTCQRRNSSILIAAGSIGVTFRFVDPFLWKCLKIENCQQ